MAVVSITIPDAIVPRLVAAARYTYPQHAALTDVETFKAATADQWRLVLMGYEATLARTKANADGVGIG